MTTFHLKIGTKPSFETSYKSNVPQTVARVQHNTVEPRVIRSHVNPNWFVKTLLCVTAKTSQGNTITAYPEPGVQSNIGYTKKQSVLQIFLCLYVKCSYITFIKDNPIFIYNPLIRTIRLSETTSALIISHYRGCTVVL